MAETAPVEVVAGVLERNGRYLVAKRSDSGQLPNLWEFPGGKVEEGESLEEALEREFHEELGIGIRVEKQLVSAIHHYPRGDIRLSSFRIRHESGEIELRVHQELFWAAIEELRELSLAPADLPILEALEGSIS